MPPRTPRIHLRDFVFTDRAEFVDYQMDPSYRGLYDLEEDQVSANNLFDLFVSWQVEKPRHNFQFGLFDTQANRLCGCAGLRRRPDDATIAVFGIELAPDYWGSYRIVLDAATCLVEYGFKTLKVQVIVGTTASGNKRVEKLARWFGAGILDQREGPKWMRVRGWHEVDWALTSETWRQSKLRNVI